jgi:MerR family transcriptional regulator, heat shock protein HspR
LVSGKSRTRTHGFFLIGTIARRYGIHPQTLRLYEREGLIRPARTEGNTRLYGPETLERLELILALTRDLGVNLAGVEVILNLKEQLREMQGQVDRMMEVLREEVLSRRAGLDRRFALVKTGSREVQKK